MLIGANPSTVAVGSIAIMALFATYQRARTVQKKQDSELLQRRKGRRGGVPMAELPHIGRHCDAELCHLLDFLPVRCDACSGTFCLSHFTYEGHNCKNAYKKNVQVPVCPVCDKPVPTPKGVSADAQVNEHILNNCAANTKKKLVPVHCPSCKHNFCLGHRHEKDHDCEQLRKTPPFSKAAAAAIARNQGGQNCASQARTTVSYLIQPLC
ncbi:AN1-like Zinc finger [Ancylostoma duodenale]|uniref:AN1-like Zinc finger n=1 Tax=Ancylostoma duodenale TaxID=51022 RepID=A0A0C2G6C7_9BILA|nr:AN1-like Zinc finger [Ancylostoma duodenale]